MKSVRCYHWLLYDMRFRIVYTTILAIMIGIGVPILIYFLLFNSTGTPNYGSCLINRDYRFECLINEGRPPTEDECIDAMCCYENDDTLPFKCHHSFTPAYQYEVVELVKRLNSAVPSTEIVDLRLQPKYETNERPALTELMISLEWVETEHFMLTIYDPAKFDSTKSTNGKLRNSNVKAEDIDGDLSFDVSYSVQSEFFFIQLKRNLTSETVFDTRLGPVISDANSLSFTTILPTPYFSGLKGGQGGGYMRSNVINGPGSQDLPFYISFESSGLSHGVLIETESPFIFDVIGAPAALFHLEGPNAMATLHFFVGPTPIEVYRQLHKHLSKSVENDEVGTTGWMPPYWSLGLHLCRKNFNDTETYEELQKLNGRMDDTTQHPSFPYDSDCIDENFRTPFEIDDQKYPTNSEAFLLILDHLSFHKRRILLYQKIGLDFTVYGNGSEISEIPLILHRNSTPLVGFSKPGDGEEDSTLILYPDYLDGEALKWAESEMKAMLINFKRVEMLSGLVLGDNFPLAGNSSEMCEQPGLTSRLQNVFYDLNLICPDALHMNTDLSIGGEVSHFDGHNLYGQEAIRTLKTVVETIVNSTSNERILAAGASIWTKSALDGAFTGLQVPFTWQGLTDSLSHLVRNFMLLPFAGIPICGSFLAEESPDSLTSSQENGDDLCLRWFQLGLLLPFARNTYELNAIRGPLDMTLKYRNYLIGNVRSRYKYNPYYYTSFYESQVQAEPLIRPLSFDFNQHPLDLNATASIVSQFMIGPALMVAPILSEVTSREAYFPTGTWYDVHGNLIVSNIDGGRVLTIPSVLSELPMYIRTGHIIPTLSEVLGNSAAETRAGNYTLVATFPTNDSDVSKGSLFVDDGVSKNSISTGNFDYVIFKGTTHNFTINAECGFQDASTKDISKIIDNIKIFGFPSPGTVLGIDATPPLDVTFGFGAGATDDETTSLEILGLGLNWCDVPSITFTWLYE